MWFFTSRAGKRKGGKRENKSESEWWVSKSKSHCTSAQSYQSSDRVTRVLKMSANTMEANNDVFSEPLGLKASNPGSLRKKFASCRVRCLDFIHLVLALTFCNNFTPRKGPRSTAQGKQSAAAVQSQDPQLIVGSAQRGMEVRRKPEIHTDRFVVSQRRHYHKYSWPRKISAQRYCAFGRRDDTDI